MEFRILGPLEVLEEGRVLELGGQKQRALLAALLLHPNEVVSQDRLMEALWEERPPDTALKALQVYVSQLRKLLGKERLETRPPGYVLRIGNEELDLARFQRLLDEANPKEALALWRGEPLSDFAYSRFAQAEIGRLEELRLSAVEEWIEQDLAAGRHSAVVGELEALVQEHPLRERLRAQLMLALYRSGRQAEALDAYQDARRALTEELGIDPGKPLRDLHQQILNQDPALDLDEIPQQAVVDSSVPAVAREARKTVTVLFADLVGSTELTEQLDPESLRKVMSRYFEAMRAVLERHGGTVEKFIGDAVVAIFGVPVVHEDDALRAVRAASEMRERLATLNAELEQQWGIRLSARIAVNTGEVVTGGPGEAQTYATGSVVNVASRLQEVARTGEVLIGGSTHRLVRDTVLVEPVEPLTLKGTAAPTAAFRLTAVLPSLGAVRSRFEAPMVGRIRERRRLQDAFEQAVGDRSCQLFTVLGLAGVGKSRLVREFLADLTGQARVAGGRCLPYGEGITYWPLMEVVQDAAGLEDTHSPEEGLQRLAVLLEEENDAEIVARRVGELIGLAEVGVGTEDSFAAVRALFESLGRRSPLVIVFDDIHWGEATFLDLIEHVADWIREAPVLLVCIARPELLDVRPNWGGGKLNVTTVLLEPLSAQESAQLVDSLAGDQLDESVRERIVEAAEGNPLFVEEMLALAMEDGQPDRELVVPPTIQALLAARLDRLGPEERVVIEHAAVEGKVFYEDAVTELSSEGLRPNVPAALGALLHKELIRPDRPALGGRAYRFRHLLIRDAAYDSIPKEARAEMHKRFGRWLEHAAGERAAEYEEVVGYHLEQAYRYRTELGPVDDHAREIAREAAERLGAAGRRAFVRSDGPAGLNLISRAVAMLPPDDPLRVELIPNVRAVQGLTDDLGWADRVLTEAVEAAATTGDRGPAAHALVQRGLLRLFTEADVTAEELLDSAQRAIAVFEELHDELGLARAWRLKAQAHYLDRRLSSCAEASEHALDHARRAGDLFERREIVEWLVVALFLGPAQAAEAEQRCRELLEESAHDPVLHIQILGARAFLTAMQGRLDEADASIAQGRRMIVELGDLVWLFSYHCAQVYLWQGDGAAAEAELRPPYDALKKIGEKSHFSAMAQFLAAAVYMQERYEEAEQLAVECKEAARPNDVAAQIMWRAIRAKVLAQRGELGAAEPLAREAVAIASTSDFLLDHADALMDLGEVLQLADRHVDAAAAVEEAIRFYERKGNVLLAAKARSLLEAYA